MRGRSSGRKGPNPLTRSYESNGPDVKIRGTAQHIAEKYLQLARDAQSSGDTIMAESLLQHAEHYFRLIAAAQQQQQVNGYARTQLDAPEADVDDDDDFAPLPDRFAPLSERLPPSAYQPQLPPQAPFAPQPQPHFAPPQPLPQPFEERPIGGERPERQERHERPQRPERQNFNRDGGERPRHQGYDRNREPRRFAPRPEPGAIEGEPGPAALPSFITAPVRPVPSDGQPPEGMVEADRAPREHEGGVNYHLSSRRRRRPRPPLDEAGGAPRDEDSSPVGELPLEPDRY
ncbi:DUF4167 domain-containing protein [Methylocystis sp. 9N]|uniref:DUF4167 domain-containing protein n=1 Tax=Methylocystis borbori TaxID=3118750 RepID=A0ABU7XKF6_9HYPH